MNLITDRTQFDVDLVKSLVVKGYVNLSESEKAQWDSSLKGSYNASDLNRVGEAINYLKDLLSSAGYYIKGEAKVDFTEMAIPTREQLEHYLDMLGRVRKAIKVYPSTPELPTSMDALNYRSANNIEKMLLDVEELLFKLQQSYMYCGELYCGGM